MDPKKLRNRICSVPGCGISKKKRPEIGFFCLPKNPRRAECWLDQICVQRKPERNILVCEKHFEEALINRTNPSKRRLDLDAVPTLKLPRRPGKNISTSTGNNSDSNTEQSDKFEPLLVEKRRISEKDSTQSEKKNKIETNAPSRSLDGGAVLSLQLPSQPILPNLCQKPSTTDKPSSTATPSSTAREVPDQKRGSKTAPLKFIEYVYKGSNDSKAKLQADKLDKEKNVDTIQSQYQPTILVYAETPQETRRPVIKTGAIPTSNNIQDTQEEAPTSKIIGPNIESEESLQGIIEGASTYCLKLHEIRQRMKQLKTSKAFKQLSLKLYLRFPNEYQSLYTLLDAPSKSELRDVFNDSIISTERLDLFTIYLTQKANTMTVKQKQCFLCIGESKIKPRIYYDIKKDNLLGIHDLNEVLKPEPATSAVVLILQGIFEEWKQPIAVGYVGNNMPSIRPWVDENIKNLFQIGFDVRAIVSQKGLNYFTKEFNINKKKIYCFNDMSFLFNSFYYNFIKFGYYFDGFSAKGQHIVEYYKLDSSKQIPLTPKLTEDLLNPANVEELNIKSVMEVFSMTTAAAISAYIDFKFLDVTVRPTVELIIKMSKLYDILNTGRLDNKSKKGFIGEQSEIDFFAEMFTLFDIMKLSQISDVKFNVSHKFIIDKFRTLIKSILALWDSLKDDMYEYLPIWRFTTDAVDLFFDQVQKHSKSITKPTAKEVDSIFRQTAIIHLLKKPVKEFGPFRMENVLNEFQTISLGFKVLNDDYINYDLVTSYKISSSEYMTLETDRKDGIIFLAGFLLKKCSDIHKCDQFTMYNSRTCCNVEALSMCESIMDDIRKNVCILPSADFIEFVEAMEISFRTFFNKVVLCAVNKKILNSLLKFMDLVDFRTPCPCFPVIYIKKLYSRFRIYHTLKYNNELIRTKICRRIIVNKL